VTTPWNNPVIWKEVQALMALPADIEPTFQRAIDLLMVTTGRVFCTGVGKSGHIARKVASTMTSLGTPAFYLHPTEAGHGDLGAVLPGDSMLAFSRSGRAVEMETIFEYNRKNGIPVVLVSENDRDSLARLSDVVIRMPKIEEAWGHAPTTSTIVQLAIGDAIAITLAENKGYTTEEFHDIHPNGEIGKRWKVRFGDKDDEEAAA
jgi:arabinose-5-phosphate isomerase|tara:strand:+ start:1194 stop:1808 length:615 start_codon:yes stop_codon:yes gene_type:complete